MITAEEAEMNIEIYSRSRYGHLMDKYINADSLKSVRMQKSISGML